MSDNPATPPTIVLHLSMPPSANRMWKHAPGRMKVSKSGKRYKAPMTLTDEYKVWLDKAGWETRIQMVGIVGIVGKFRARFEYPMTSRKDEDNIIKPLLDLCQRVGVIRNDSGMRGHEVAPTDRTDCLVALWDLGGEPLAIPAKRWAGKPRSSAPQMSKASVARGAAIYARAVLG